MKRTGLFMIIAALVTTTAFTFSDVLPIGSKLPKAELKMMDVSGKQISMKDVVKANGLLVMFSCNTCPYVIKNQQRTIAVCEFAQKANVGVILLNSNESQRSDDDSFEAMINYSKEQQYKWNYVIDKDNTIADAFGANRTPECFLFDKSGKLVYHGAIDDNPSDENSVNKEHLKEAIRAMSTGKEIVVKETRSVGCSIKRIKN